MSASSMRDSSPASASVLEVKCNVESSQVSKSRMWLILDLNNLTHPDSLDQQYQSVPGQLDMSRGQLRYMFCGCKYFTRVSISWTVFWVKNLRYLISITSEELKSLSFFINSYYLKEMRLTYWHLHLACPPGQHHD